MDNKGKPLYKKQADTNLFRLQTELIRRTSEGIFVISCQKENPIERIARLKNICQLNLLRGQSNYHDT